MNLRRPRPSAKPDNQTLEIHAEMHGSLTFKDPVHLKINGKFQGSLDLRGTLSIGQTAHVEANVTAENIIVAGKVLGDITAHALLVLMPSAVVKGNISTPKLNIVEGAIFQGNCQMREDLLGIDEVSKYLEIDMAEIERLASSGKIPGTKNGSHWKFERAQIDHWASSGKIE